MKKKKIELQFNEFYVNDEGNYIIVVGKGFIYDKGTRLYPISWINKHAVEPKSTFMTYEQIKELLTTDNAYQLFPNGQSSIHFPAEQ